MAIEVVGLSSNPTDSETGLYAEDVSKVNFSAISWATARESADAVSSLSVVQVSAVDDGAYIARISDDVHLIEDIQAGDYIACDSYVVWHIPAADWASQGLTVDGSMTQVDLS